jgi:hypothetical protein
MCEIDVINCNVFLIATNYTNFHELVLINLAKSQSRKVFHVDYAYLSFIVILLILIICGFKIILCDSVTLRD